MPKIEIGYSMKDRVYDFFEFLKERAMDPCHEAIRDLVADFIDKFLIVEMKRLESEKDICKSTIEIPKKALDTMPVIKPGPKLDGANQPVLDLGQPVAKSPSGNGHKWMKVRDLTDPERDTIRTEFIKANGQIDEGTCLLIKNKLDKEVTIFQVTGFVFYLHKLIAERSPNAPKLKDKPAYLAFRRSIGPSGHSTIHRSTKP